MPEEDKEGWAIGWKPSYCYNMTSDISCATEYHHLTIVKNIEVDDELSSIMRIDFFPR